MRAGDAFYNRRKLLQTSTHAPVLLLLSRPDRRSRTPAGGPIFSRRRSICRWSAALNRQPGRIQRYLPTSTSNSTPASSPQWGHAHGSLRITHGDDAVLAPPRSNRTFLCASATISPGRAVNCVRGVARVGATLTALETLGRIATLSNPPLAGKRPAGTGNGGPSVVSNPRGDHAIHRCRAG